MEAFCCSWLTGHYILLKYCTTLRYGKSLVIYDTLFGMSHLKIVTVVFLYLIFPTDTFASLKYMHYSSPYGFIY